MAMALGLLRICVLQMYESEKRKVGNIHASLSLLILSIKSVPYFQFTALESLTFSMTIHPTTIL